MSAVAEFFESFGRAFSHLVVWAFLLGVAAHLLRTVVRSRAWRNYLAASFPNATVRWRDAYGAYLVKQGAGIFLPMHGDDVVRVGLMKDRIEGASAAAIAATAGIETLTEVVVTVVLVGVSAWLGTSVIDWREVAAHPVGPAIVTGIVLVAIVSAVIGLRKKSKGKAAELKQALQIFKRHGTYARTVLVWQLVDLGLQFATLYFLLVAFGYVGVTLATVVLIRTAQRVTVSLPGFLETGSTQAMIVAILADASHTAGQAFGFGFGSKVTTAGLNIVLAMIAARVMIGPLHLGQRLRERFHRPQPAAVQPALHVVDEQAAR